MSMRRDEMSHRAVTFSQVSRKQNEPPIEAAPVDSWRREEAKPVCRRYLVCGHTPASYACGYDSDVIQITQCKFCHVILPRFHNLRD